MSEQAADAGTANRTKSLADDARHVGWIFIPLIAGGGLTLFAGPPSAWKSHIPPGWVAMLAFAAALYITLSKWRNDLEGAGPLLLLSRAAERATPTFVFGCTAVGAIETAIAHRRSPLPLVAGGFSLVVVALLIAQLILTATTRTRSLSLTRPTDEAIVAAETEHPDRNGDRWPEESSPPTTRSQGRVADSQDDAKQQCPTPSAYQLAAPVGATPPTEHANASTDQIERHFRRVEEILEQRSAALKKLALWIGAAGLAGVCAAAFLGIWTTWRGMKSIEHSDYHTNVVVYEMVRTAAGAALLAAFIWGMLNLARAALDQSTRYEKRLVAGHFLVYVLNKFENKIGGTEIALGDVMTVFKAWSDSVDSAFTHVKFGSKDNQGLAVSAGPGGVSVATGGAQPIPQPPSSDGAPPPKL